MRWIPCSDTAIPKRVISTAQGVGPEDEHGYDYDSWSSVDAI
jgi:hypothetical protein